MRNLGRVMLAAALVPAWAVATIQAAHAADGYVTAASKFGPQSISAPVRHAGGGRLQVRLPSGTWIECRRSCSDTLRRETVDFWQNHSGLKDAPVDGPGYFLWRWN